MNNFLKINKINGYSILKYLLTVTYPNYIIILYTIDDFKILNIKLLNYFDLYTIINQHRLLFNILLISSIFIIPALSLSFINFKQENKSKFILSVLKIILTSVKQVIEVKRKRFLEFNNKLNNKHINKEEVFLTITQPLEQINRIFDAIKYSFDKICNDDDIKVSIIKCENNKMVNYLYQSDDRPTISINELINNNSTAKQVIQKKKTVLIEDTTRKNILYKKKWFYKGENDISKIKSILCFPLLVGNNIYYLITLTSKEQKTFKQKYQSIYEFMLQEFGYRIILETYLYNIKEKIQ